MFTAKTAHKRTIKPTRERFSLKDYFKHIRFINRCIKDAIKEGAFSVDIAIVDTMKPLVMMEHLTDYYVNLGYGTETTNGGRTLSINWNHWDVRY